MRTILIVDDEPHLRLLYETELRYFGYSTISAANAEQCLGYVATMNPDLVVLDIRMPGMDGIELLQRIRARDNRIPILIYTAYSSCRDNYLTWTADAFLQKSSDLKGLIDTVRSLVPTKSVPKRSRASAHREEANNDEGSSHVEHAL